MGLEHPDITRTLRAGYPDEEPVVLGRDTLDRTVYEGDVVITFEDYVFVKEELSFETIDVLKILGATLTKAY